MTLSDKELTTNVRQYIMLRDETKTLTERQSSIKKLLSSHMETIIPDDKGHHVLRLSDAQAGSVTLTRQRRVSKSLDMDIAEDILTKKGIKEVCTKTITVLDDGAIMAAYAQGRLTEEDIDAMFPAKVSYAFLVETE